MENVKHSLALFIQRQTSFFRSHILSFAQKFSEEQRELIVCFEALAISLFSVRLSILVKFRQFLNKGPRIKIIKLSFQLNCQFRKIYTSRNKLVKSKIYLEYLEIYHIL